MEYSRAGRKLQEQIAKFSGKLCVGFPKVVGRFVAESIYGVQARGSVRLSEIGRALNESIPLKKTINRLSYELSREGLWKSLTGAIISEASRKIGKDTLLVLDLSDITKPYARKMEYLSWVHDGSSGELGEGYSLCHVIGVECGESGIVPLYSDLYSTIAPDFEGENKKILSAMRTVRGALGNNGIWVIDRGGDRNNLLIPLVKAGTQFIIRLIGNRNLIYRGKAVLASRLAKTCPTWYSESVTKESEGGETSYLVSYGFRKVKLPGIGEQLYLLVVNGFGAEPLMILTNRELHKSRKCLWWHVMAYISRWRIEETIRFIKQSYSLEDIRLLTYQRLRNMMALVNAAIFFAAAHLGLIAKLKILASYALGAAKRIFGIPDFRYYAIADGIREILKRLKQPFPKNMVQNLNEPIQLELALFKGP